MKRTVMLLVLALLPLAILELALRIAGIGGSIVYEENAAYGYRPKPDQRFATMGHPIRILESGFRGPPATNDLLVVGDSVTYGTAYLRDEETFSALLGAANGGVNGWGPQNIARFLAGVDLAPYRAVVWVLPSCDVLRPFMTLRGGLISTNRRMWLRLEYLVRFLWYGHIRTQTAVSDPSSYDANWAAVQSTHKALAARGCRLLLIFVPYRDEALGAELPETPYYRRMIAAAGESDIPHAVAEPTGDVASLFRDSAHLTAAGNRWLADVIARAIEEHHL